MWQAKFFDALSARELYAIYRLRMQVFQIEQGIQYPDIDEADLVALHGMLWENGQLVAYYRLVPEEQAVYLGRVVVVSTVRGRGLGHQLVNEAINQAQQAFPEHRLQTLAQAHLVEFYQVHGFSTVGEPYQLHDVLHQAMIHHNNC